MLWIIIGLFTSYLIGSIPTAYIFGRFLKGIDIRQYGSGNVGATNALRVLGKKAGITVLLLDILKGFIAVYFISTFIFSKAPVLSREMLGIIFGVICICGHNWTVFLQFKGGKGMATTLGVLIGLAVNIPGLKIVLSLSILVWILVFIFSRIVSLASVISAVALPVFMVIFKQSVFLIAVSMLLSAFVIIRHKANIKRIIEGKEAKISFKKSPVKIR